MFGPNDKCLYLYVVILTMIFITCLFTLGLQYLSYDKSNKIIIFNYTNPDITIQAIKEFDLKPNITIDYYKENMSFLGLTGDIKLICYSGLCQKYLKKICERERCYSSSDSEYFFNVFNKNKRRLSSCETYTYNCSFIEKTPEFKCSEECATNRYSDYCDSCSYKYDSKVGYCESFNRYILYTNDSIYCKPSNIIFFWKELYYEKISYEYSYANDAVLKNETCPDGKRPCGVLDIYGNKLCIPKNEKCPINYIKMGNEPPDKVHSFVPIKVGNKTIYYSYDFVEDGRIIKGLYSDSDIEIKYNKICSQLDTYNLSYFLNENKNIYKDVRYIPEYMKNNGNSYLYSCDYEVKNLDLNQIKNDYKLYQFSQKFDIDIYGKLKDKLSNEFFCSFFGSIYLLVYLFFSIWAMIYGKLNRSSLCCFWCFYNSNFDDNDIFDFIIFFIFLIPYNVLSILSTVWSSINLNDLNESNKTPTIQSNLFDSLSLYHKLFILGNIAIYSLIFVLFILSILVFFFKKTYNSNNINYTKLNDK